MPGFSRYLSRIQLSNCLADCSKGFTISQTPVWMCYTTNMQTRLSLAQFDIKLGDPQANLDKASGFVCTAKEAGSQLLLLPELWATGYDLENWQRHATDLNSGMFGEMAHLARQNGLWVGGSLLEKGIQGAYNTFAFYNSRGGLAGHYRKIHLFRLMDEHLWLLEGDRLTSLRLDNEDEPYSATAGLAICYDLRFPEVFRSYALQGARLILIVAEWPSARLDHWQTLLRARAIENQCFIAAVNCTGNVKGEHFGGRSAVIDPWGVTVKEANESEELLTVDINLESVDAARQNIPVFSDRRPEAY
jgi:omega-amidase